MVLNLSTTPEKCRHCTMWNAENIIFNIYFFSPMKNCPLHFTCEFTKLSNICHSVNQNAWRVRWPAPMHASHSFQQLHNGLYSSTAWWTIWLTGCKNNLKCISTQNMVTFNNCCDVPYLKFKLPFDKTTGYLRTIHFFEWRNANSIRCTNYTFHKVQWRIFQVWWTGSKTLT